MGQRPSLQYHQWEGVYAADFTLDGVRRRCRSLAEVLRQRGWSCLVAADTRFMSAHFALDIFRVLESAGVQCSYCAAPVPLPAVERALEQRRTDCALIVSAANRPFWYNGLIVLTPPVDAALLEPHASSADGVIPFPSTGSDIPEPAQIDLRSPYLDALRAAVDIEQIRRTPLTLFVDPMNGTTSGYIPAVLGEGGQTKAIEINRELDPLFARQTPHPFESGLARLRKLVKESDSHFGVAIAADGRALGVVDNAGELVPALDLALLLAQHLSRQGRQRGLVIMPHSGDEVPGGIRSWEENYGLKIELSEQPAARIAEVLERDRNSLVVGTTATGDITLGRYGAVPDALLAALTLTEAVARTGVKLRVMLNTLRGQHKP